MNNEPMKGNFKFNAMYHESVFPQGNERFNEMTVKKMLMWQYHLQVFIWTKTPSLSTALLFNIIM